MSRTTTTRADVMNGGLCSAVDERGERRQLGRAFRRARVVVVGLGVGRGVARAPATRQRVIVERERAILAAEQLVDEALHLAVAQRRIGTLDQEDAHSNASIVRQTRAVPSTSCTRTIRHPCIDAVRDRGERLRAAVVDLAPEQLADEPLVRRRQQERVAERRVLRALAQQHRALGRRLAEVEAGVEHDLLGSQTDRLGALRPARAGTR